MSIKISACPFCGGHGIGNCGAPEPYVYCERCDASVPGYDTIEAAIAAWNRRAPETCLIDTE